MKKNVLIFFCLICFSATAQKRNSSRIYSEELTEVMDRLKQKIDSFAFDEDSNKRRYKVRYEGDYMRLLIMKADGSKPINKGLLYNFNSVYKFDGISFRKKDKAYINIYVDFLDKENYPKRKKWVKIKLIMKVFGHENAEIIMSDFKKYSELLIKKNKNPNRKF